MLLSVSLDGYADVHDKNRGKDGIFEKIISNLERLSSVNKRPMVDIKTIVLEDNLESLPKLYKLCSDMNFDFFSISFLRNNNLKQNSILSEAFNPDFNGNYPIEKYFDMEHFKEIYKELESMSKNSKVKIRFSPKFEYCSNPLEAIEKFYTLPADRELSEIYKLLASQAEKSEELVRKVDQFLKTSGRYTDEFERKLADYLKVKYCSLVNSGSSA